MTRLNEALSVIAIVLIFMIAGTIDAEEERTQQYTQGEQKMFKWILSWLGKTEKPVKVVMLWNGRELQHWSLTKTQYDKLMITVLPRGYS